MTDTGELAEMLDLAERRWPDAQGRRELLLRLAAAGRDAIAPEVDGAEREQRRARQRRAMEHASERVDVDALLSDAAWR